ncbi:MAG TPA: amidase, partial [Sedimenticola sp.]|nr:amidase [Sedimenticola sp.]
MELYELSGAAAAAAIRSGETTSEELVQACLERIAALEGEIGAWEYLEPALALRQAREADRLRRSGRPTGPLHGVPVGIKDIFDTGDMPTTDGTVLHAGRTPGEDATAVARLREAGAVIMGKTVTAELAFLHPGRTRNPHDPTRTPGGSSSGSAAAVAAAMVPLAIGTQTNGSVIRPAAYCGVCGYKPTRGLISRHRVLRLSRTLDQVGVFGRTPEDLALIAEAMSGCDEQDPDMRPRARPALVEGVAEAPPVPPRLAFVKTPAWNQADQDLQAAFAELTGFLGDRVEELDLDGLLTGVYDQHRAIMEAEMAWNLRRDYARGAEAMSRELRGQIEA